MLDADVAWLGFGPDDPVHDFGFSKNGADTMDRCLRVALTLPRSELTMLPRDLLGAGPRADDASDRDGAAGAGS